MAGQRRSLRLRGLAPSDSTSALLTGGGAAAGGRALPQASSGGGVSIEELLLQHQDIARLVLKNDGITVTQLRLASRALRDAVDSSVEELSIRSAGRLNGLLQSGLLARLPSITSVWSCSYLLIPESYGEWRVLALLRAVDGSRITRLSFATDGDTATAVHFSLFAALPQLSPRLQTLELSGAPLASCSALAQVSGLSCLRDLDIYGDVNCTGFGALAGALHSGSSGGGGGGLRQLTRLKYQGLLAEQEESFCPVPDWSALLPQLTELRKAHLYPCNLSTLLLLGALPKLEEAIIRNHPDPACGSAMDESLLPAASFASLGRLCLYVSHLSEEGGSRLQRAAQRMAPRLESLTYIFDENGGGNGLASLLKLTALTHLDINAMVAPNVDEIGEVPELDDALLVGLSRQLSRLESLKLKIQLFHQLSDIGFLVASRNWSRLRDVYIWDDYGPVPDHVAVGRRITAVAALAFLMSPSPLTHLRMRISDAVDEDAVTEAQALLGRSDCDVYFY